MNILIELVGSASLVHLNRDIDHRSSHFSIVQRYNTLQSVILVCLFHSYYYFKKNLSRNSTLFQEPSRQSKLFDKEPSAQGATRISKDIKRNTISSVKQTYVISYKPKRASLRALNRNLGAIKTTNQERAKESLQSCVSCTHLNWHNSFFLPRFITVFAFGWFHSPSPWLHSRGTTRNRGTKYLFPNFFPASAPFYTVF